MRWVHVVGTGVDRFPMEVLGDQILTCSRGASAVPISEWAMAHILAEAKRLPEAWVTEKPERWFFPLNPAATLVGQKLAIIGLGAIATETARRAMAFGMEVTALRRTSKPAPLPGIRITASPDELVAEADCLLVACALTDATRELVDAKLFSRLQAGSAPAECGTRRDHQRSRSKRSLGCRHRSASLSGHRSRRAAARRPLDVRPLRSPSNPPHLVERARELWNAYSKILNAI